MTNILEIPFDQQMIQRAYEKSLALGSINNSILKGKGNTAGYLGEEAVAAYIKAVIMSSDEGSDKYNHDLIVDNHKYKKIEVKTKRRKYDPKPSWQVSIAKTSRHQKPDLYIFTSITFGRHKGEGRNKVYYQPKSIWITGQMEPEEYFSKARLCERGKPDPDKRGRTNDFETHVEMYNMNIEDLEPLDVSLLPQKH